MQRPWWTIALTVLLVAVAGAGIPRLQFTDDIRVWFSPDNPHLRALRALEGTYTKNESVFYVLAPANGDVFTRDTLAAVQWLTDAAWQLPHSTRVSSISNFQHTRAEGDTLTVQDLVRDAPALSPAQIAQIRRIALDTPELVDRLVARDGATTAVHINIVTPEHSSTALAEISRAARAVADRFRARYPDITVHLTGSVLMDSTLVDATRDDLSLLVPVMLAAIVIVMGLLLRSAWATLAALLVIALSVIVAMGAAGWAGVLLDPASGNAPTIILTLAVADSIHLLLSVFQRMHDGVAKARAIRDAIRINFEPVVLTSVTTTIGFLSMNFSEAPPFHALGNIVAVGVMAALVLSLTFLPAFLALVPLRGAGPIRRSARLNDRLADLVTRRPRALFRGILVGMLVLFAGVPLIELDDDFIRYFDRRYEVRRANDFVEARLTGLDTIEYSLSSGEPGGISRPDFLAKLDEFADWYRRQDGVVHVQTITDVMKRLNMNMHGDREEWRRIPARRDLAAQYLLVYEMSLPAGLDLNDRINIDKSATRVTVTLRNQTAASLRRVDERAQQWLRQHAPAAMHTQGTGLSIIFAHISHRNIRSMLTGSFAALILISALLMLALRSLRLGAISLVPNLAPAFMMFGLWGYTVGKVGLAASVLAAVTLGIVVDDTIHFLNHYRRARHERGESPPLAVRSVFHTVGTALWSTTAVLMVGFGALGFSAFQVIAHLGVLAAGTIALALLLDLLFLPALLLMLDNSAPPEGPGGPP